MLTLLPLISHTAHPNTDSDDFVINKFERVRQIYQAKFDDYREQLLEKDYRTNYLAAFPKSRRHYKYHSVISVSVEDITSSNQNFRFLRKMKQKVDFYILSWLNQYFRVILTVKCSWLTA